MSVKAPVAPPSEELDELDRHLAVLSNMLKTTDKRELYIRKINKLLDQRNKLTADA